MSAQEAVYLALQILLTKCTRGIVFINTSTPEERIVLLKPKSVLDELPAESTDVELDHTIQRYSKNKRIGYNINIMRQSACLVFNPITVNNFAFLFNCTPVGRASDSMMAPT